MLKRFLLALLAFVGLIIPVTFVLALLAAPPARPEPVQPPGCDRNLANATASVAGQLNIEFRHSVRSQNDV